MPDGFNIDLSEIAAIQSRLKDLPDRLAVAVDAEIQEGARDIAAEAKQRAPGDYGFLKNETGSQKLAFLQAEVFAGTLYAAYVEFGTRANVSIPPGLEEYAAQFKGSAGGVSSLDAKTAIFGWCERQGIDKDAWYPIYITIMTKGIQAHPFFFPAVNRIQPIIINRITKILSGEAFKIL